MLSHCIPVQSDVKTYALHCVNQHYSLVRPTTVANRHKSVVTQHTDDESCTAQNLTNIKKHNPVRLSASHVMHHAREQIEQCCSSLSAFSAGEALLYLFLGTPLTSDTRNMIYIGEKWRSVWPWYTSGFRDCWTMTIINIRIRKQCN